MISKLQKGFEEEQKRRSIQNPDNTLKEYFDKLKHIKIETAKEILKKHVDLSLYTNNKKVDRWVIEAMEEYANQFKK